ncbi:putative juvenile hormone acid methyltransferase [Trypoxylus dichotomus]
MLEEGSLSLAKKHEENFTVDNETAPRNDAIVFLKRYSHLLRWQPYEENILDIGCGDGSVTKEVLYPYLKEHVGRLEAVDLSKDMIEHAKMYNELKNVHYRTVDMNSDAEVQSLGMKFDHIFSFYCIHWILDQRSLFKRLHNLLNQGGQIFIATLSDSSLHKTFKKYFKEGTWSKFLPNACGFTDYTEKPIEFMINLLEEIGFEIQLCTTEKHATPFDNFKGFIRSLVSVHRFINFIPEEFREEYILSHIMDNCEYSIYSEDTGKYSWAYESFMIIASKK